MNSETKSHFEKLLKALKLEKTDELENYKSLLDGVEYSQRISEGITLYPVEFIDLSFNDFGDQLLEFKVNIDQEASAFRIGKIVEVFNADGDKCSGQIGFFRNETLTIKGGDEDVRDWISKGKIGVNALVDTKTYDLFEKSLEYHIQAEKKSLVHSFYEEEKDYKVDDGFKSASLNEFQNQAVNDVLSERPISIIHGPPGTGKTTTLVAAINKLLSLEKRILVCAPSNAAVDNLCRKLINDKIDVLRLGNESKMEASVASAHLDNKIRQDRSFKLVQTLKNQSDDLRKKAFKYKRNFGKEEYQERKKMKAELKSLRYDIRKIQKDISSSIIENAEVICGTFFSIQQMNLREDAYDYLLIDEAGQAIEPAIWSVSSLAKKMVLAGDSFQLPPTVKSSEAIKMGLAKSILERADEINFPRTLLRVQYRMNELIMSFSNQRFYDGQLMADESVASWSIDGNENAAVEFIDTAGCGHDEIRNEASAAISNPGELDVLLKILPEFPSDSLGVITPYRGQLSLIQEHDDKIDANTIDSFQGQERDTIIISLVRSNENGEIGFLSDYRRMNVAMTRARKKLMVIGDSATIGQDSFYADFLEFVENNGSYRTAWEFI